MTFRLFLCLVVVLSVASGASIVIDLGHSPGPDGSLGPADDLPTPTTVRRSGSLGYGILGVNFTSARCSEVRSSQAVYRQTTTLVRACLMRRSLLKFSVFPSIQILTGN